MRKEEEEKYKDKDKKEILWVPRKRAKLPTSILRDDGIPFFCCVCERISSNAAALEPFFLFFVPLFFFPSVFFPPFVLVFETHFWPRMFCSESSL